MRCSVFSPVRSSPLHPADEERYFAHFAPHAVFLGTDATERWDVEEFRRYAHPYFAKGKAWSFRAVERHVTFSPDGSVAWFDEKLDTPNLGPSRGSGVLVKISGRWKIAHYDGLCLRRGAANFSFVYCELLGRARLGSPAPGCVVLAGAARQHSRGRAARGSLRVSFRPLLSGKADICADVRTLDGRAAGRLRHHDEPRASAAV